MKFLILVAFCILTAATCKEKSTKSAQVVIKKESKQVYVDSKGRKYKFLAEIPENLRTSEQKKLAKSLNDVLLNGVVAENNHMVLKMSKVECLSRGMTENNYYKLLTDLEQNNRFFDSHGTKNVAEAVDDLHRYLKGDPNAKGVPGR